MKTPNVIGIFAGVILIGWVVFDFPFPKELRYQGRTITQWLEPETRPLRKNAFNTRSKPKSEEAQLAIKAIGTKEALI